MRRNRSLCSRDPDRRRIELLALLLALAGVLAMPAGSGADQVYKACGKKWLRQAHKLPPEQLAWMMEKRSAELTRDLDGDGLADTVTMTNTPSFRSCEVKSSWNKKETTIQIRYGNGKGKVFHWIDGRLVERLQHHPRLGRILVTGLDAQGRATSRWVEYRGSDEPTPASALAEARPAEGPPEAAALQVASLR